MFGQAYEIYKLKRDSYKGNKFKLITELI